MVLDHGAGRPDGRNCHYVWLWSLLDPQKLRRRLIRQLEDPANELWLSPISTWEVVMLAEKEAD
jgi:PIN domain nuclease of toxin-antitoxin system